MTSRERGEAGQFVERATLGDILGLFDRVNGPVLTTSDVAEAFDITNEAARQKFVTLYERGEVDKRKTGRTVVYWHTGGERITPDERADEEDARKARDRNERRREDTPDSSDPTDTTAEPSTPPESPTTPLSKSASGEAPESLEDVRFPVGRDREESLAAVLAARDHIRAQGKATMRELVTKIMPEHPVGYDLPDLPLEKGERYRGSWWRKVVRPGLEALDDVVKPPRGASAWRYVGDGDAPEDVQDTDADADEEIPTTGRTYDPTGEF